MICLCLINIKPMKRVIRGKRLQGTPFFISLDQQLGKGTYGQVYRTYNTKQPSQQLVVKIISLESDNQQSIETQLHMLHQLPHHDNLVNCIKAQILSSNNLYIVMEYCNQGSLQNFIQKMTLMPEDKIWDIFKQICKGYQVLYDSKLVHRDIKPDNILIHNKIFKLADFGLSKKIKDHKMKENLSYAGSPLYIAPQIIDQKEGTSKIDVFSLGSILYQLAYDGNSPFFSKKDHYNSPYEYYEKRKTMKLVCAPRNKKGEPRSQELRNLIAQMLQFNFQKRISWQQIFQHPKININQIQPPPELNRATSMQQKQLQKLKKSLQIVKKSSATMQPIAEEDNIQIVSNSTATMQPIAERGNIRQQTTQLTLQLINFQQFLEHSQLRNLQQEMIRLKITELTILHCNNKIAYIVQHKILHKYIIGSLKKIVTEGVLYLLKVNFVLMKKIRNYQPSIVKDLLQILEHDRSNLIDQFEKQSLLYKDVQLEKIQLIVDKYDLRRYEDELYSILTEYNHYPLPVKQKLSVTVSLLVDIYDSSLKLTDMIDSERVVWDKYQDINEIQTKMDQFCYNKLEPHHFYNYLIKKEHIKLEDNNAALKKMGLLFT